MSHTLLFFFLMMGILLFLLPAIYFRYTYPEPDFIIFDQDDFEWFFFEKKRMLYKFICLFFLCTLIITVSLIILWNSTLLSCIQPESRVCRSIFKHLFTPDMTIQTNDDHTDLVAYIQNSPWGSPFSNGICKSNPTYTWYRGQLVESKF